MEQVATDVVTCVCQAKIGDDTEEKVELVLFKGDAYEEGRARLFTGSEDVWFVREHVDTSPFGFSNVEDDSFECRFELGTGPWEVFVTCKDMKVDEIFAHAKRVPCNFRCAVQEFLDPSELCGSDVVKSVDATRRRRCSGKDDGDVYLHGPSWCRRRPWWCRE